jgi:hypothetical protein
VDHPERVAGLILEASPLTLRGDAGLEAFAASVVLKLPIDAEVARSLVVDTSSGDVAPEPVTGGRAAGVRYGLVSQKCHGSGRPAQQ